MDLSRTVPCSSVPQLSVTVNTFLRLREFFLSRSTIFLGLEDLATKVSPLRNTAKNIDFFLPPLSEY